MIVYRCLSELGIANMMGIPNKTEGPRGYNTFKYEENIEYTHFFYYYDSAISFLEAENLDRYFNKYVIIAAYDIDEKILKEHFGLGKYNFRCIPKDKKDKLLQFFEHTYFPEFAIPTETITKEMLVGIGNSKRITPVSYINAETLEQLIGINQQSFLEYEKWLFDNGTNVQKEIVLNNSEKLFPISQAEEIKKLEYLRKINNK